MNTSSLSFDVAPSDSANPLSVEVWVNDQQVADHPALGQLQNIVYLFNDEVENNYAVKIVVKNKTSAHTQINEAGEIVSDSLITIDNFKIDEIEIDQVVYENAVYTHDFNGSQAEIRDRFYGTAGCNGVIAFEFTSPGYLWLLENM
jgi:hypothetical protein